MMVRMSAREFMEWKVYFDKIEPFGEWREDMRAGMMVAPLLNAIHAAAGSSAKFNPSEWVMDFADVSLKRKNEETFTGKKLTHEEVSRIIGEAMAEAEKIKLARRKGTWQRQKKKK